MIGLQGYTWVYRGIHEFTRFTRIFTDNGGITENYYISDSL